MKVARQASLVFVAFFIASRAALVDAQTITQRGFAEAAVAVFPEDTPADRANAVGDALLREELFIKPAAWLQFAAGVDVRLNTHGQVQHACR
jgi:hypothetical protein